MMGLILTGGKSSRMKQDKALLKLDGISLLQRQYQFLERHLGKGNVIVSGDRPEFPHVKDIEQGLGPIEGVRSVCRQLIQGEKKLNKLFVVPVDMPFLTDSGFDRLVKFGGKNVITKFAGQQLPIGIVTGKQIGRAHV